MKKYFEFSGTISGMNYFLRNLLSTLVSFCAGFLIGWGLGTEQSFYTVLGFVILSPAVWFNMCTIYKRSNGLFPEYAIGITISMFFFQILGEINQAFTIPAVILGLVLLFKNSDIEEHNG